MSGQIPRERQAEVLSDLQTHGKCIALEFRKWRVAYDTIVRDAESSDYFEGWEVPAGELEPMTVLMIGEEGVFKSPGPRDIGREVEPLSLTDISRHGGALAIRQRLFALETKHYIFDRIRSDNLRAPEES